MRRLMLSALFYCGLTAPAMAAPSLATTPAPAAAPAPAAKMPLQFDDISQITSWRPGGDFTMFVQNSKGNWYKVSLYEPCMRLYPGQDPTFATETDEQQQRDSAVMIAHHKCQVTAITPSAPPAQ